jgi:hypothetical protein
MLTDGMRMGLSRLYSLEARDARARGDYGESLRLQAISSVAAGPPNPPPAPPKPPPAPSIPWGPPAPPKPCCPAA